MLNLVIVYLLVRPRYSDKRRRRATVEEIAATGNAFAKAMRDIEQGRA